MTAATAVGKVSGVAVVYDSETVIAGNFRELIAPGALVGLFRGGTPDVPLVVNHDQSRLLARPASGTMQLADSSRGLRFHASLPDTSDGRDVRTLLQRRDLAGCSFAFAASGDAWYDDGRDLPLRVVTGISLLADVSIVTQPAYLATSVSLDTGSDRSHQEPWRLSNGEYSPYLAQADLRARPFSRLSVLALTGHRIDRPGCAPMLRSGFELRERDHTETMAELDPEGPWGAYRGLAESRGVSPSWVAAKAARGELLDVVRLPAVEAGEREARHRRRWPLDRRG